MSSQGGQGGGNYEVFSGNWITVTNWDLCRKVSLLCAEGREGQDSPKTC